MRRPVRGQESRYEATTRRRAAAPATELAKIGDDAESALRIGREPGAIGLQIAATHDSFDLRPGRERCGWPGVEFVTIGGDHQPVMRVAAPRED